MVSLKGLAVLGCLAASALGQSIRYMPFGDSITEFGCWRAYLWQKLQQAGYRNIDFVGSMSSSTNCQSLSYDRNHEGHAGYLAINIANQNQLVNWLRQYGPADIITMHLGTNDVANSRSTNDILAAFTKLVDQMRASNPNVKIIVAQIIPLPLNNQPIINLNNAIPAWASGKNTTQSPIYLVDQYTGFTSGDLKDGVHPNDTGDRKMADKWYPAFLLALKAAGVTPTQAKREVKFIA